MHLVSIHTRCLVPHQADLCMPDFLPHVCCPAACWCHAYHAAAILALIYLLQLVVDDEGVLAWVQLDGTGLDLRTYTRCLLYVDRRLHTQQVSCELCACICV